MTSPPPGSEVIAALRVTVERVYTTIIVVDRDYSNVEPNSVVVHHSFTRVRDIGIPGTFSGQGPVQMDGQLASRTFYYENGG
jgi:hypothetical protein